MEASPDQGWIRRISVPFNLDSSTGIVAEGMGAAVWVITGLVVPVKVGPGVCVSEELVLEQAEIMVPPIVRAINNLNAKR